MDGAADHSGEVVLASWGDGTARLVIRDGVADPAERGHAKLTPCWLDFYCDWGADIPLWINGSAMAHADTVPVSADLLRDLMRFQEWFVEAVDIGDEDGPEGFDDLGRALLARVRNELPPPWRTTSSWYDVDR
ncbi:MAG: hypothetical protein ACTHMS_16690 [Jatrophihabitans sp.]|uniref:hypothetical protein n=1 Tax=Jatrophihabitans sp. TaxID=1932789 RepID=UPI003F7D261F